MAETYTMKTNTKKQQKKTENNHKTKRFGFQKGMLGKFVKKNQQTLANEKTKT